MVCSLKHKIKTFFNSKLFSRSLVFCITCSIIFSYAVLCPQASTISTPIVLTPFIDWSEGEASISNFPPEYDCLGSDNLFNLAFTPDSYLLYDCNRNSYLGAPEFVEIDIGFYNSGFGAPPLIEDNTFSFSFAYCITYDDTITIPENGVLTIAIMTEAMAWDPEFFEGAFVVEYYTETVDEFSGRTVRHCNYELVFNQDTPIDVYTIMVYLMVPTFYPGNSVGYTEAVVPLTNFYFDPLGSGGGLITPPETSEPDVSDDVSDGSGGGSGEESGGGSGSSDSAATIEKLENIYNAITETGATVTNIYNSLVDVSPEMQESINHLDTLLTGEKEKVDAVVDEMDKIDTDFGGHIHDFDNTLKDNADSLSGMGSTTYNSFVNDVFGHWFFVAMFALFGAFAFFSRAVFG